MFFSFPRVGKVSKLILLEVPSETVDGYLGDPDLKAVSGILDMSSLLEFAPETFVNKLVVGLSSELKNFSRFLELTTDLWSMDPPLVCGN